MKLDDLKRMAGSVGSAMGDSVADQDVAKKILALIEVYEAARRHRWRWDQARLVADWPQICREEILFIDPMFRGAAALGLCEALDVLDKLEAENEPRPIA